MAITPLPPAPLPTDSTAEFNSKAFALVAALDPFVTQTNATAVEVDADASTALGAKNDAQAAAASAVAAANATKWVSGTTYTEGSVVWSPISYLTYRRKTTGGGTTDPSADFANWAQAAGTGDVTATGTQALTNKTISGADNTLTVDGTNAVGFRTIPQNSQSTAYTFVLADSGKHILHPSADTTARTFTIPANGSVAFPVGTAVTFINQNGAGVVTIAITTDTMRLAGAGTTGSRTLAANGIATAIKVTSTEWIISGTGLT
jgi:hypothetical protein